ncbi:MAG: DegT/DnrJ/EryC1/StrS family aminotransferase [Desulfonatronovibrionaceae bacterium]
MIDPVRRRDDFLVFGAPHIEEDEVAEVVDSLRAGWIGTGPKVARFEENFCRYKGSDYAVAVNSCTAALHLSLIVAGIGPGDEVITTPLTFCSTVNSIIHSGATPVLADVDPQTMNIDPAEVEKKITARTKAVLPVHFAGRPCAMDRIMDLAGNKSLQVIEDCAHAIESAYQGTQCGLFGDLSCFSFYVTKNLVTGEGGMILTPNNDYAARLKVLALHGMSSDAWRRFSDSGYRHYMVTECGFKYNMTDMQAALGLHQLEKLENNWKRRRKIWDFYNTRLSELPIGLPPAWGEEERHALHLYTVLIDPQKTGITRDDFLQKMHEQGIGTGVHYLSIPEHKYYQDRFGWRPEDWPAAAHIGRQTVSLPMSSRLTDRDAEDVVRAVRIVLGDGG